MKTPSREGRFITVEDAAQARTGLSTKADASPIIVTLAPLSRYIVRTVASRHGWPFGLIKALSLRSLLRVLVELKRLDDSTRRGVRL